MRLIRTDAGLSFGRQLAVCLCVLFLLGGVGAVEAAPAPVNAISVSSAQATGLRAFPGRLLGVIGSQMACKAMIELDGVEQPVLVSQGDLISGYTVESIEEDTVSIKQGDAKEDLFVFKTVKYVASNKSAKTVKDVPSETELAEAKTAKSLKVRVPSRQLASAESEEDTESVRSSSRLDRRVPGGAPSFLYPLGYRGKVSSPFGDRDRPKGAMGYGSKNHKGTDIAVSEGSRVYAAAPGVVVKSGSSWSQGNYVVLSHGGGYETSYYHLYDRAVPVGKQVRAGQLIGHSGDTGISTGPHLHFQIEKNGIPVNPANYVRSLRY
ncbi:MAG TPA: M23 family metallopeptidase [Candidatus Sumerlaeota bacterium]|nr:M23 family metallopeptidase [Candidatus Sumerlaeota bacterium]